MRLRPLLVTVLSTLAGVTLAGAAPLAATPTDQLGAPPGVATTDQLGAPLAATPADQLAATPGRQLGATPAATPAGRRGATPGVAPPGQLGAPLAATSAGQRGATPAATFAGQSAATPALPAGRLGATVVSSAPPLPGNSRAGPVYSWPLDPPHQVLRPFEAPADPYGPGHRGIDLGGTPGQPVRAAAAGTVVFAGPVAGRGVISVDHESGLRTTYEPVTPSVTAGQRVAAGEVLGQLMAGHPGCPVAACLHWGVRRGGDYLDPLGLLGTGRVRLLPWED